MSLGGFGGVAARLFVTVDANVGRGMAGLRKTDAQFQRTAASARAMDAANARAGVSSAALGRSSAASAIGMAAAKGGALALAVATAYSVKKAIDYEAQMRNVNSIARLSEGRFKSLSASVLDMSGDVVQSPTTLAKGMYQLVSSGFDAADSLRILRSSAKAASAGLTTTEVATTAVAGVLNAYQLKAKDAAQVSDDLFQTVNLGVLTFEDLAQGIGPVLPIASKLGVSLKQVGAMTATLTKGGVPAAEAFTYMKGAMVQLIKPSEALQAQFDKIGVKSGGELIRKTGSLQGALESLYKSVDGNQEAFAALFPDIRGMTAAFAATGKGAAGAAKDLRGFANTAGAANDVFEEQNKSTASGMRRASTETQALATNVGGKLAPAVNHVAGGWAIVARAMNEALSEDKAERHQEGIARRLNRLKGLLVQVNKERANVNKGPVTDFQAGAVNSLVSSMRRLKVPDKIQMRMLVTGDASALAKLGMMAARVKSIPDQKRLTTILSGDGTVAQKLAAVRKLVFGIPSKRETQLAAKDKATATINAVRQAMGMVQSKTVTLTVMEVYRGKGGGYPGGLFPKGSGSSKGKAGSSNVAGISGGPLAGIAKRRKLTREDKYQKAIGRAETRNLLVDLLAVGGDDLAKADADIDKARRLRAVAVKRGNTREKRETLLALREAQQRRADVEKQQREDQARAEQDRLAEAVEEQNRIAQEHAAAMSALSDELRKNREHAQQIHNVADQVIVGAIGRIGNDSIGGILSEGRRTASAGVQW